MRQTQPAHRQRNNGNRDNNKFPQQRRPAGRYNNNNNQDNNGRPVRPRITRHIVKITGHHPNADLIQLRSHLENTLNVSFLEFRVNNAHIEASLATKAEALAMHNQSGLKYGNKQVWDPSLLRHFGIYSPTKSLLSSSFPTSANLGARAILLVTSHLKLFSPITDIYNIN